MTKDKEIEELFSTVVKQIDDSDEFMSELIHRLDAVEYIRQQQKTILRRYRIAMVVAFIVGTVSGIVTLTFILSAPTNIQYFTTINVHSEMLLWFTKNSKIISATIIALLTSFCFMNVITNLLQNWNFKESLHIS